jgi:hypothetical protein
MPMKKQTLTYDDYVKGIYALKLEEQLNLIKLINSRVKKAVNRKRTGKNSILELEGLGADIWKGVDAQAYVEKERKSWD